MKDLDTIRIYEGLGDLRFGARKADITALLGSNCSEERTEDGDLELTYPELGLTFTLWADQGLSLGYIDTERATATLRGTPLLGRDKVSVRKFLSDTLQAEISEEGGCEHEDGVLQEWIDVDEYALMLWFLNGRLYRISWSAALDAQD